MTSENESTDLEAAIRLLDSLNANPEECFAPDSPYTELVRKVSLLSRRLKSTRKRHERSRDQEAAERTSIRQKRTEKEKGTYLSDSECQNESAVGLASARNCYICKTSFQTLHEFYDALCPNCAQFNFDKRSQSADLLGRTALVTGGRIKIGFQIALKLLRAGAKVIVTSRFAVDTADRYARESDFEQWAERLCIYSADFRFLPAVTKMADQIAAENGRLNILINNASQTVRRPPEYYRHLFESQNRLAKSLPKLAMRRIHAEPNPLMNATMNSAKADLLSETSSTPDAHHIATMMSQVCLLAEDGQYPSELFPQGQLDFDGQQIDRRALNSWIMELGQVPLPELLEVHAVNSLASFILIQRFKPLLLASPHPDRYVVNVSAVEGQFGIPNKTGFHPHTNMAKAAMNMVTRTCGERFAEQGVYMSSVDTGWVTNEFPYPKTQAMKDQGFEPPLDEIDGAARVCDPVFSGVNENRFQFGTFLKDYRPANW